MVKVLIKYENEEEKSGIIELLSKGSKIKDISKPQKTGKFSRVYVDFK